MNQTHEDIEELLAGYVLRSLTGEDAAEADRLLMEHVPFCATCREALTGFQRVAGELALDAPAIEPPELLLPRIERELEPGLPRRRSRGVMLGAAASFVAIIGMAGIAITQGIRANNAQDQTQLVVDALDASRAADANLVNVGPMTEISQPGLESIYIYGTGVPDPRPGMVYRVWLGSGEHYTYVGEAHPDDGLVILHLAIDPTQVDRIVITEESKGSAPVQPGTIRWDSAQAA